MVSLHSLSLEAALAAEAAALQGEFWNMHNLIYQNQMYLGYYR
jgi:protein-disulfide isomerase